MGKKKLVVYGPALRDIEVAEGENFNSILCERLDRLVRESKCFSKLRRGLFVRLGYLGFVGILSSA